MPASSPSSFTEEEKEEAWVEYERSHARMRNIIIYVCGDGVNPGRFDNLSEAQKAQLLQARDLRILAMGRLCRLYNQDLGQIVHEAERIVLGHGSGDDDAQKPVTRTNSSNNNDGKAADPVPLPGSVSNNNSSIDNNINAGVPVAQPCSRSNDTGNLNAGDPVSPPGSGIINNNHRSNHSTNAGDSDAQPDVSSSNNNKNDNVIAEDRVAKSTSSKNHSIDGMNVEDQVAQAGSSKDHNIDDMDSEDGVEQVDGSKNDNIDDTNVVDAVAQSSNSSRKINDNIKDKFNAGDPAVGPGGSNSPNNGNINSDTIPLVNPAPAPTGNTATPADAVSSPGSQPLLARLRPRTRATANIREDVVMTDACTTPSAAAPASTTVLSDSAIWSALAVGNDPSTTGKAVVAPAPAAMQLPVRPTRKPTRGVGGGGGGKSVGNGGGSGTSKADAADGSNTQPSPGAALPVHEKPSAERAARGSITTHRFTPMIPQAIKISSLSTIGMKVVATMRSPWMLQHAIKLLRASLAFENPNVTALVPKTGATDNEQRLYMWSRRAVGITEDRYRHDLANFVLAMSLYHLVRKKTVQDGLQRAASQVLDQVSKANGISRNALANLLRKGKVLSSVCNGHYGLLTTITTDGSICPTGITYNKMAKGLTQEDLELLPSRADDGWAESMCRLGWEVIASVAFDLKPSDAAHAMLGYEASVLEVDGLAGLQDLLKPWAGKMCACGNMNMEYEEATSFEDMVAEDGFGDDPCDRGSDGSQTDVEGEELSVVSEFDEEESDEYEGF